MPSKCQFTISISSLILGLICIVLGWAPMAAANDSAQVAWSTDDGPHVFWSNDRTAIVFYYCDDSVLSRTLAVSDTLRFTGFCNDDAVEYTVPVKVDGAAPGEVTGVERFFAVSDVHGDFEHLSEILLNAGTVDSSLNWNWGKGHLIFNGDVFDRGPAVTECLWLIYRLEQQAARAGGAVHFLLGNHELMVLRGDLRYIHERYTGGIAKRNRFTYDGLFGPDMALGRWLRTKRTVLRVNRTLFVHGGVATESVRSEHSLSAINNLVRRGLDYTTPQLHFDTLVKHAYGSFGPLWYRGYTRELDNRYPALSSPGIDSILVHFDADQVVVGHSEQDSLAIHHDGKVIAIDVDVESLGGQQALLWEGGRFYRVDRHGVRRPVLDN